MAHKNTLREHRTLVGLSQQDVADAANIHRNTYLDYESGNRLPPLGMAWKLAEILHTTLVDLWPRESA